MSITDANNNTTQFEYDSLNRLVSKIWPDSSFEVYGYDAVGNQISHQLADGAINQFSYDILNRLTTIEYFDNTRIDYTYTPTGQRETIKDNRGITNYEYDSLDRVLSITTPYSHTISYTYDIIGNLLSITTPITTTNYEYDALNRLNKTIHQQDKIINYSYNAIGLRTAVELANGINIDYTYDQNNRLINVTQQYAGNTLKSYQYTFDNVGNRTSVTEENGNSILWEYDGAYRLIKELWSTNNSVALEIGYTHDGVGNRLTKQVDNLIINYTYNALDQLLTAGSTTYAYDVRGNLTSINEINAITQFEYDASDRIIELVLPDTTTINYQYDSDGRRVSQTLHNQETRYLWDELSSFGNIVMDSNEDDSIQTSYILANGELLVQEYNEETRYYLPDGQGNIRALTDDNGSITDQYSYEAFGVTQNHSGTTTNAYQYSGQQYDDLSGLYYLRARYYDPELGRFLSRDRAAYNINNPIEVNRYGYVHANPVNSIDPSGLNALSIPLPGKAITAPPPTVSQGSARPAGGGGLADYAGLIIMTSIGSAAIASDVGKANYCMYLRSASVLLAILKQGATLALLSQTRPDNETCVIPVFLWNGDSVAYHIHTAQYERGRPMLKTLDRDNGAINKFRRELATAPCHIQPLNPPALAWGGGAAQCDEYPYASTLQGGITSSVMFVRQTDNSRHGGTLGSFYNGGWTNKWGKRLPDGSNFATVILFWRKPLYPHLIAP